MDKKSILNEIKKLITFSTETLNFLDAKLNDGTIVRVEADAFAEGLPLLVVTPDGLIPAPTGEHTLEDGTVIVVDEAGLITSVTPPVEQPAAETPAPVETQLAEEDFYTWDQCMLDMMDEYGDEQIASAVCGKIKADGYIMSKEEAFAEGATMVEKPVEAPKEEVPTEDMGKKIQEMEARIAELEKLTSELIPMMKETAEFGTTVINKLDTFVQDTPAELQFNSIKSEYKGFIEGKKEKAISGLEGIKTIRKK